MRDLRRKEGRQVESFRSAVGWDGSEFVRSGHGVALIEYALLLGAVACTAMAGVYFCNDLGIPVFQHLSGALVSDVGPVPDKNVLAVHAVGEMSQAESPEWLRETYQAVVRPATVLLAAALLIAVLWLTTRRRRTRTDETDAKTANERDEDRLHIKRQVLWRNILDDPRLLLKNRVEVRHLMTRDVSVVARHTQADEIRRLMSDKHMHHVLVCDSDGHLLGVVSDRDLPGETVEAAARIMTPEPMTVRADTTASAAIAMMLEHQISCLPVLDDGQVCGILTRTDLLLSLQCMLQWWLRFAQTLARTADCADKIDAVQEASGRYLFEQRARLEALAHFIGGRETSKTDHGWEEFEEQATMFLNTAGELIAMQTFEGDRLSEMAGGLLEIAKS